MAKTEADNIKKIEASFLRKHGYFKDSWRSGAINWTNGWSGNKSSVGINVSTGDEKYLRIYYTQTDNSTGEKKDFDYKVPLETTPCNFGGVRYWFKCFLHKRGVYCGRRVAVLYKDGDWFGCRHCYELTYESRNVSGRYKRFGRIISFPEIERLRAEAKRVSYRGKYTKKYLRYLRMEDKSERSIMGMAMFLGAKADKLKG